MEIILERAEALVIIRYLIMAFHVLTESHLFPCWVPFHIFLTLT